MADLVQPPGNAPKTVALPTTSDCPFEVHFAEPDPITADRGFVPRYVLGEGTPLETAPDKGIAPPCGATPPKSGAPDKR